MERNTTFVITLSTRDFSAAEAADGQAAATITRTYQKVDITKGVQPGDTVIVTVKYKTTNLNFPFLPFVKDGIVDQTAEARVDNVTDSTAVNCS